MISQQHAVQGHLHTLCASYKHVMLEAMQIQKQTVQFVCKCFRSNGTMQRKSTAQTINTKTRKLVKVQAIKSDDKLKKKSVKTKESVIFWFGENHKPKTNKYLKLLF